MKSRLKSILSVALSIAMLATIMPGKTVLAEENTEKYPYMMFAASSSDGAITINSNSFNASGNIATNGTVVSGGTLNVNGTKTEHANEEMINVVKKLNNSYFNADAVERYSDDYSLEEINININDPIDVYGNVELIGNISLNSSIKASEDININGEVINANNAVICSETGDININTSNVNFSGLIYAPYGNITINADNLNLNSVIVIGQTITIDCPNANVGYNNSMGEFVGSESDIDAMIFAYGEYNSDANAIDIEWITNYTNSNYEIWVSDDNIEYSSVAVVSDETTYQYTITEDFEIKYFKVSLSTKYGELIESIPIVITKTDEGYSVEYLDSDNDGIPDVFENTIGTDINNVDSDNDGLTDYEEVYITGTDPTKYDSVSEGVSDADADSDNDRLSNKEEIELGTDPQKADTDNDGLSDYDEIYVYGTDPLVPDTDNDGIKDGDELNIGLDPTNPETFDVPDAEYVSKQIISADSDVLKEINTENSPYQLSVEVESTGYVEGNLTVSETRYSKAINNGAILGIAPELICDNSCNISKVVIQFDISDAYVENELYTSSDVLEVKGLERLLIFKYFEDYNMLLPIETQYDLENNVIYAEVDELGTYCIMNMEKLTSSLDLGDATEDENEIMTASIESSMPIIDDKNFTEEDTRVVFSEEKLAETNNEEILAISDNLSAAIASVSTIKTTDVHTPIDVAFLIQTSGQLESTFKSQCTMIGNLMDLLIEKYGEGNVRFCLITYGLNGAEALNFTADGDVWFTKSVAVKFALNSLQYVYTSGYTDRGNAFKYLQNNITFKETSAKYIIQVMNGSTDVGSLYFDQINMCANLGINYSELMPANYKYINPSYGEQVDNAISSTGGLNLTYGTDTENKLYRHIVNKTPKARVKYNVILPTSWFTEIVLDDIISPDNGTDTDRDNLTDWEEINTEDGLISWNTNGSIKLPTIRECLNKVHDAGYSYVLSEYNKTLYDCLREDILDLKTLPIHSNPCDTDSDGDNFTDLEEFLFESNPLANSVVVMAQLKNNYVQVENYNTDDDEIRPFGGYQGWFKDEYPAMKYLGCGIIASCDVLLYMYQNGMIPKNILNPNEYDRRIPPYNPYFENIPKTGVIPYDAYYDFVTYYYNNYCTIEDERDTRGTRIANCMEDFLIDNKVKSTVKWGDMDTFCGSVDTLLSMISGKIEEIVYETSFINTSYHSRGEEEIAMDIIDELNRNIPVIISSGPYSEEIAMYTSERLICEKENIEDYFYNHYATITAIYYNDVLETYVLKVSSWGKTYYIDFNQYYENKDIFSDVFTINLKGYSGKHLN